MLSLADGRHFKAVYGKDFVESLLTSSDFLMAEREKSADDQLAAQRNQSTSLQGQINLMRSHQAQQDQRISFALAQEAEVADARSNSRSGCLFIHYVTKFFDILVLLPSVILSLVGA